MNGLRWSPTIQTSASPGWSRRLLEASGPGIQIKVLQAGLLAFVMDLQMFSVPCDKNASSHETSTWLLGTLFSGMRQTKFLDPCPVNRLHPSPKSQHIITDLIGECFCEFISDKDVGLQCTYSYPLGTVFRAVKEPFRRLNEPNCSEVTSPCHAFLTNLRTVT